MGRRKQQEFVFFGGVGFKPIEIQALRLASTGYTSKEIADKLNLTKKTVDKMLSSEDSFYALYPKIGVRNRQEAAAWYVRNVAERTRSSSVDRYSKGFLERIHNDLERTQQATEEGIPGRAAEWLQLDILPALWSALFDSSHPTQIQSYIVDALYQYVFAVSCFQSHGDASQEILNISEQLSVVAEITRMPLAYSLGYTTRASAAYLQQRYEAAAHFAETSMKHGGNTSVDPHYMMQTLTLLAISNAKVGAEEAALRTTYQIEQLIEHSYLSPVTARSGLETIARVESVLRRKEYWNRLDKARSAIKNHNGTYEDPYSALLLIRTEIEGMEQLNAFDMGRIDELEKEANVISGKQYERLRTETRRYAQVARNAYRASRKKPGIIRF